MVVDGSDDAQQEMKNTSCHLQSVVMNKSDMSCHACLCLPVYIYLYPWSESSSFERWCSSRQSDMHSVMLYVRVHIRI